MSYTKICLFHLLFYFFYNKNIRIVLSVENVFFVFYIYSIILYNKIINWIIKLFSYLNSIFYKQQYFNIYLK